MDKKAASMLLMIFEIITVILVVGMMIGVGRAYGKSTLTAKIVVAEDLRLMMDVLAALPGQAVVKYPQNVSLFNVILTPGAVAVFEEGEAEQIWVRRDFFLPDGYTAEGIAQKTAWLCLEKNQQRITLRGCAADEP
ncbi:hypothetical protein HYX14_01670 [Candidatus Woesearchaeota archaeon]|nr:hypothetical protein [Candidatus Woesearchaeota archaeon]